MGFWTPEPLYEDFQAQMDKAFASAELFDVVGRAPAWQNDWSDMAARLPEENISGIAIVSRGDTTAETLVCANPEESLLWHVVADRNPEAEVYVFGSIHVGKREFYPFHSVIEESFRNADHLVFEVNPQSMADPAILQSIQAQGALPEGQTLADLVSPETMGILRQTFRDLGLPPDSFLTMQPWMVSLALSSLKVVSLGYLPQFGVETYLMSNKPEAATVLELESIESQIGFLEQLNSEAYLQYTLHELGQDSGEIERLISAWQCADKEQLSSLLFSDFSSTYDFDNEDLAMLDEFRDTMFHGRNITMADGIRSFLEEGSGNYFVVVGSGHLVGDRSVIDLLQQQGYSPVPVSLTDQSGP